jgi:hypothetical protein
MLNWLLRKVLRAHEAADGGEPSRSLLRDGHSSRARGQGAPEVLLWAGGQREGERRRWGHRDASCGGHRGRGRRAAHIYIRGRGRRRRGKHDDGVFLRGHLKQLCLPSESQRSIAQAGTFYRLRVGWSSVSWGREGGDASVTRAWTLQTPRARKHMLSRSASSN